MDAEKVCWDKSVVREDENDENDDDDDDGIIVP